MTSYANNTSVPIDRSMNQIRVMLKKIGADGTAIAESDNKAMVSFVYQGKNYKFFINYPSIDDDSVRLTDGGRERTQSQCEAEIDKEVRRLWRAMGLYIKAAIEAHNNQIIPLEKSMLSHMVLPGGKTVFEKVQKVIAQIEVNPQLLLN